MHKPADFPGARWWKFDFHCHTPASADWKCPSTPPTPTPSPTAVSGDTSAEAHASASTFGPREWLLEHMRAEIDCVAVTDHNSGGWIDLLKAEYTKMAAEAVPCFRPLTIFPGVEISVSEGWHLLVLFDPSEGGSAITRILGKVDWKGTEGASDVVTEKSGADVLAAVQEAGAIALPAHSDSAKGLLQRENDTKSSKLNATMLTQIFKSERIIACETVNLNATMPRVYDQHRVRWTQVLGSDWHGANNRKPGTRWTWVKMGTPSLEGLHLALIDGAPLSIWRSDNTPPADPNAVPQHFIESIELKDTKVMGRGSPTTVRFSPWFNALIGGRGTGKSTIIHAFRLAYARGGELPNGERSEAARVFKQFATVEGDGDGSGALLESSSIWVVLRRLGLRHRLTWRHAGPGLTVEDEDQDVSDSYRSSQSQLVEPARFPIRIYSQGQLAELARDDEALLRLLDEAKEPRDAIDRLRAAEAAYLANAREIRRSSDVQLARSRLLVEREDMQRQISAIEAAASAGTVFSRARRVRVQQQELDTSLSEANAIADRLEVAAAATIVAEIAAGAFDSTNPAEGGVLAQVAAFQGAVLRASEFVRRAAAEVRRAADDLRNSIKQSDWARSVDEALSSELDANRKIGEINTATPEEHWRVSELLRINDALLQGANQALAGLELQQAKDSELLAAVQLARRGLSSARCATLQGWTGSDAGLLKVELLPYGAPPATTLRSLREVLRVNDGGAWDSDLGRGDGSQNDVGIIGSLYGNLPASDDDRTKEVEVRVADFVQRVRNVTDSPPQGFTKRFSDKLRGQITSTPDLIDRLTLWTPEDALRVSLRRQQGGEWLEIKQASAGQQAAAMLSLVLNHGDEPLVLDQPEDDLDNQLIYKLVVDRIRATKPQRQIIVVTHNANIVVNGDAEHVTSLHFHEGQCRVHAQGSLLDQPVRAEVCQVLEGGHDALEQRYRRLGGLQ